MAGKIGIIIPSHNSLRPSLFDELLRAVATSRKTADAHGIKRRLQEDYHIAIVSTGLSYLAYLGALRKVQGGYRPTNLGKRIGKMLAKGLVQEANALWEELLKRHKLYEIFSEYLSSRTDQSRTLDDFGLYFKGRTHGKWDIAATRSRLSRLCELFAEKGLIEYQNGHLAPISLAQKESDISSMVFPIGKIQTESSILGIQSKENSSQKTPAFSFDMPSTAVVADSSPIKIDLRIEISDKVNADVIAMILSFLKELQGHVHASVSSGG